MISNTSEASRRLLQRLAVPMLALGLALGLGCDRKPSLEVFERTPYLAIPAETGSIMNADVKRLRNRDKVVQLLKEAEEQRPDFGRTMDALRNRVGFDPFQKIDTLCLGEVGKADRNNPLKNTLVVARGDFSDPKPKLDNLLEWLGEEYLITPPPFTTSTFEDSGITRYKTRAQSQYNENLIIDLNFAFPSETMMIFAMDGNLLDQSLAILTLEAEDMRKNPFWQDMLKRPAISAMFWGAGHIDPAKAGNLPVQSNLSKAKDYFFNLDFNESFDFQLGLVCESIEASTDLTRQLKDQVAAVKPMVGMVAATAPETVGLIDKLYFITEKEATKISLKLTPEESRKVWEEWDRLAEQAGPGGFQPAGIPQLVPGS